MNHDFLQQLFGNEPAKIYTYSGEFVPPLIEHISNFKEIEHGEEQIQNITHKFAEAAGTNLVSCVVSKINGTYFVYTKEDYNINDSNFTFVVDLPLPVVEVVPLPPAEQEEQKSEGTE